MKNKLLEKKIKLKKYKKILTILYSAMYDLKTNTEIGNVFFSKHMERRK